MRKRSRLYDIAKEGIIFNKLTVIGPLFPIRGTLLKRRTKDRQAMVGRCPLRCQLRYTLETPQMRMEF